MAEGLTDDRGAAPDRPRIGFLHTVPATIAMVEAGMKSWLPGKKWLHIYDGRVREANFASPIGVTPKENLRLWSNLAGQLREAGCGAVASCCSLMAEATAYGALALDLPFVQLDAPVLDRAVEGYRRIGVLTTTPYTEPHVRRALGERAVKAGKEIDLVFGGDHTALEFFAAGEIERHDELVAEGVRALVAEGVDCVLLGQIPLALLGPRLEATGLGVPLLWAGKEAFESLGRMVGREKMR
ncbi:MAG: aspartate/glutamate racemase family protein [Spirochaetaceae bacterium]|nr:aspartate/glutamate racemase family protein [Spirochaetaceae bacterium]